MEQKHAGCRSGRGDQGNVRKAEAGKRNTAQKVAWEVSLEQNRKQRGRKAGPRTVGP